MARTKAKLPGGARVTDYIGLGVVASAFPRATIDKVLQSTGKASQRQRGKWPTSGGEGSAAHLLTCEGHQALLSASRRAFCSLDTRSRRRRCSLIVVYPGIIASRTDLGEGRTSHAVMRQVLSRNLGDHRQGLAGSVGLPAGASEAALYSIWH